MAAGEALARAIAAERVGLGWSQKRLAQAAGLSPGVLARIESGYRPATIPEALRIAEALDVTVGYLMRRAGSEDRGRFGLQP